MKTLRNLVLFVAVLLAGTAVLYVDARGPNDNYSPARPAAPTSATRSLFQTSTSQSGVDVILASDGRSAKRALPNVGRNYGYEIPPGDPKVVRDGFVNCDLPRPIAYIKFSTGYAELFRVDLRDYSWILAMDYEGAVLHNPLVVNDVPGQRSLGVTRVAGADGCIIWPAQGQPGYVGGPAPVAPNSPN